VIELRTLGELFLFVAPPAHLERHQRRLHVRVPLRAPVTFLRVASGQAGNWLRGDPTADPGPLRGGVIEDLSAGGFRISVAAPLQIGDFLSFSEFPVVEGEDVLARIISDRNVGETEELCFGALFLGLSATMRYLIAQHIFRLQRQSVMGGEWGADAAKLR
jgi:c-di-GMP-binding flagellar brake protein YcgR